MTLILIQPQVNQQHKVSNKLVVGGITLKASKQNGHVLLKVQVEYSTAREDV